MQATGKLTIESGTPYGSRNRPGSAAKSLESCHRCRHRGLLGCHDLCLSRSWQAVARGCSLLEAIDLHHQRHVTDKSLTALARLGLIPHLALITGRRNCPNFRYFHIYGNEWVSEQTLLVRLV